jgi:carbonic anhydrase/acetyltransferase-like protein (isoleucine patch superfamily)
MRSIPHNSSFPRLIQSEFIAPNCTIIGDVETGENSSIFFGANLRGDTCSIKLGKRSIIQDNSVVLSSDPNIKSVNIGDNVTIGNNCHLDGVELRNNCIIGNGVTIHSGSIVEKGAFVAPGSVVPKNSMILKNQIWVGSPAQYLRDVTPEESENIAENHSELIELSSVLVDETEKSQQEILRDYYTKIDEDELPEKDKKHIYRNLVSYDMDVNEDEFGMEGMNEGFNDIRNEGTYRYNIMKTLNEEGFNQKFEQDLRDFPDYFKIYNENYKRYDEINRRADNITPGDQGDSMEVNKLYPERPGAMRSWVSKWDADFNITFKNTGSKVEANNK